MMEYKLYNGDKMNDAIVNAVLSFIIPGLGQAINGYKKKGIVMFIILIFLNIFIYFFINNPLGHFISVAYSAYAAYDAYKTYYSQTSTKNHH